MSTHVGVMHWVPDEELAQRYARALAEAGHRVTPFGWDDPLPPGLDVVLVYGPFNTMTPLARRLLALPPAQRPALAWLFTEQLPNPRLPQWWQAGFGRIRSSLDRLAHRHPALAPLNRGAYRFRYFGDLLWLRENGLLTTLAVWSDWWADRLRRAGFDPFVPPRGYHPGWGHDLGLERDIPVLWLGKPGTRRRARLLDRLRRDLSARGVVMHVVDGVENPYVFGPARTELLNRTRIMVNILREPWDDNSMRYALAFHNRVLVVTEPTLPHTPQFRPGEHLVAVPVAQMARTIVHYLEHEEERRRIVEQAYGAVPKQPVPGAGVSAVIDDALARREAARTTAARGTAAGGP